MKTKLLAKILFLFCVGSVQIIFGQLNYLKSGAFNLPGTYTDLGSNGSAISTANFDNANSAPQNIGFTFNYNGTAFTQFVLNTNGFIKLGDTNPSIDSLFFTTGNGTTGGAFNSTNPADTNILCVFNHDLKAGTNTPEYRVYTSGTPGSQVCTIQFKNVRDKTTTPAIQYDNMDFQIKLYETTNTIEFIYGIWSAAATGTSATKTSAVGLKGKNNTNPELLVVAKTSLQAWTGANFISGNYTGSGCNFGKPPNRPAPDYGRTFRFIQAFPHDAYVRLYTLGNIPNPYGAPRIDSATIRNIGIDTLKNLAVTLNITGANTFTDTKTIPVLAPGAYATIGFSAYSPTNNGKNNVSVTLATDDNMTNNTDTYSQIVNNTVFSYADSAKASGATGGQFFPGYMLTRYSITGTTSVTAANIYIANDPPSIGQNVYAIIFDDLGNKLDSSAILTITAADTGKYYHFLLPLTPTINNSSFYIGLAQPAIGYYPLGYQKEPVPVRLGAYFFRQMGLSTFTEMGGTNISTASSYRLMIQAEITNTTGVLESISENTVIVYPNPFNNTATFKIQSEKATAFSFTLYDVTGKIVKTIKNITSPEFKLEREDLQSGIYFYTLISSASTIKSGKLIIE